MERIGSPLAGVLDFPHSPHQPAGERPSAPGPDSGVRLTRKGERYATSAERRAKLIEIANSLDAEQLQALLTDTRKYIEDQIEDLIAILDDIAPNADLEPDGTELDLSAVEGWKTPNEAFMQNEDDEDDGSAEPALGWPALGPAQFGYHPERLDDDREVDNADWEDDGNAEPSLGAIEQHPSVYGGGGAQLAWAHGESLDREIEDGNDEPDADGEYSLGWRSHMDQSRVDTTWNGDGEQDAGDEREVDEDIEAVNEDGGDILDQPHDEELGL